jgi:hypothetical protein
VRRALIILALSACGEPTVEEHCTESCRFYSECDAELEPLEGMCIAGCTERFLDPMRIVTACVRSVPRHPVDRFRDTPSVSSTAIEAGRCARDQGCPPDMPDMNAEDPCEGVEHICLDGVAEAQICSRDYEIGTYGCSEDYQRCTDGGGSPDTCQVAANLCFEQAYDRYQQCR